MTTYLFSFNIRGPLPGKRRVDLVPLPSPHPIPVGGGWYLQIGSASSSRLEKYSQAVYLKCVHSKYLFLVKGLRFIHHTSYRAFSCYVTAAMLEGKNNTFSLPWEISSIFMQNCFIVSALQHGRRENPL